MPNQLRLIVFVELCSSLQFINRGIRSDYSALYVKRKTDGDNTDDETNSSQNEKDSDLRKQDGNHGNE
ncbi:hypothetical protein [Stieleria varia]|uniref:hypothetical protein n=1 Tax=Stieleria varia TaxID=2528005 RepID=UPI001E34AFC5|nr:hypothetical protein [Stieleria varia]